MDYQALVYEVKEGVASLRLNRPDAANAFNMQLGREFMHATLQADADPSVRAVLLSAEGKMFCGGGDLASFANYGEGLAAALKELTGYLHLGASRLMRMDAPVIIAVQGVAAGAGMSVALSGDIVLASDKARFTMAYTRAGLVPDGGSTYLLPRLVGMRRAQELMLENRMLSAQEAADWGIATRVVPHDDLHDAAQKLASEFAAGPTGAFGATKRLLADTYGNGLESQMELESRAIARASTGADALEGIDAFVNKRPPIYKGSRF